MLTNCRMVETSGDGPAWKIVYLTPRRVLYWGSGEHFHPADSLNRRMFSLTSRVNQMPASGLVQIRDSARFFFGNRQRRAEGRVPPRPSDGLLRTRALSGKLCFGLYGDADRPLPVRR